MSKVVTPDLMFLSEDKTQDLINEKPWMKDRKFSMARTIEEVRDFIDKAIAVGKCVIDFETTGLSTRMRRKDPETGKVTKEPAVKLVGVGLCYDHFFAMYVPLGHQIDDELNLKEAEVLEELRRLCKFAITIYHNAKYDTALLNLRGIFIDGFKMYEDTQLLARLYDANQKDLKLKNLSERFLNQPMLKFKDMVQTTDRFDLISPLNGYYYGASDAICTFDLYNFFINSKIIQDQMGIYNMEKKVVFVVMEMESNMVKVDVEYLQSLKDNAEKRIAEIKKEICDLAEEDFNIGSPVQLGKILTGDKFKFNLPKTDKGAIATDNAALKALAATQPICKKLIAYRSLEKSLGTYINNLLNNHDEEGFIKLGFNQSGTDTGRFSSPGGQGLEEDGYCGVNVQSIPKAVKDGDSGEDLPDIRKAMVARPGKTIVAADYENEEMRVAANLSGEKAWIDAVNNGIDFHTATGAIIAGKPVGEVTSDERKLGKTTNFLALYMGGARTLASNAGISENEAKRVLSSFYAGVPRLKAWMEREIKASRKSKYVTTLFGRKRPLAKFYDTDDRGLQNHGDRCVSNTKIQGCCADIMKTVMAKMYSWIHRNNLQDDIKILITMHDELVMEITTEKLELFVPEITKIMMLPEVITGIFQWPIPLTVDVKYGDSWRVKKKFYEDFPHTKARISEPLMEFSGQTANSVKPAPVTEPPVALQNEPKESSVAQPEQKDQPVVVQASEPVLAADIELLSASEDLSEPKPESTDLELIYTLRDTGDMTLLHLNNILKFILQEMKKKSDRYSSPKKVLRVRDPEGHSVLVSEYKIPIDLFLALSRFFRV